MKALVLYESFFGNTQKIAEAVGAVLAAGAEVQTVRIDTVQPEHLEGVNLLIVGSPTRGFRPGPATQAWLKGLGPTSLRGVSVAAFDTRVDVQKVDSRFLRFMAGRFGYAAEPLAAKLVKQGGSQAAAPAGFFVKDTEGPLAEGELERAAAWAQEMIAGVK
jgi:flavodoxin